MGDRLCINLIEMSSVITSGADQAWLLPYIFPGFRMQFRLGLA